MISNAPYLAPRSVTPWQAAAHPASQTFLLIGTVFLLPLVLAYTAFVFWVFRGKVAADAGYHRGDGRRSVNAPRSSPAR